MIEIALITRFGRNRVKSRDEVGQRVVAGERGLTDKSYKELFHVWTAAG